MTHKSENSNEKVRLTPPTELLPWPPPKEQKYKNLISPKLTQALLLFLLSVSVVYLSENLPDVGAGLSRLILIFLNNILSLWLGYAANNYYRSITESDPNRREALKIADELSEFLQDNSTQTNKTINALLGMVDNHNNVFRDAARYFMTDRAIDVRSHILSKALRIHELGYDSEKFSQIKIEQFDRLNAEVEERLRNSQSQNPTTPNDDLSINRPRLSKPQK